MTTDERIIGIEIKSVTTHKDVSWLLSELKAARAYMARQPCPSCLNGIGYYKGCCNDTGTMLAAFDRQREKEGK